MSGANWWPQANLCLSPHAEERPANSSIDLIVIHSISLPPGQFGGPYIEQLFSGQLDPAIHPYFADIYQLKVSAHLLIRRDGSVIQFVDFARKAWHAGQSCFQGRMSCNDFSIGIELEGCDLLAYSTIQYQRLKSICQWLRQHYPIQAIVGHADIALGRKTDPGPAFDWSEFLSSVEEKA